MQNTEIKYPANVCEQQKTGDEPVLLGNEAIATVSDYWRWAHSDLNSNAERGKFAEFLVACSLDLKHEVSQEWGAYDICWADGEDEIKIEVKTSAYLQIWDRRNSHRPLSAPGLLENGTLRQTNTKRSFEGRPTCTCFALKNRGRRKDATPTRSTSLSGSSTFCRLRCLINGVCRGEWTSPSSMP